MHNDLGMTPPVSTEPTPYFGRRQVVGHAGDLAEALRGAIEDPEVRQIANKGLIGSIDQFSDSTVLASRIWLSELKKLFEP